MTVRELGARMSSSELAEWIALANVDPWGEYRADMRSAVESWASCRGLMKGTDPKDYFLPDMLKQQPEKKVKVLPADRFLSILNSMG